MTLVATNMRAYLRENSEEVNAMYGEPRRLEAALRETVTPARLTAALYAQPVVRPAMRRFRRERINRSRLTGHALMLLALAVYPERWRG